jgi:hypothetical protein
MGFEVSHVPLRAFCERDPILHASMVSEKPSPLKMPAERGQDAATSDCGASAAVSRHKPPGEVICRFRGSCRWRRRCGDPAPVGTLASRRPAPAADSPWAAWLSKSGNGVPAPFLIRRFCYNALCSEFPLDITLPRLSSPFLADTRPECRRAGGVDGNGAQGEQRGILGAGQREERFAQQPNRRQKASVMLAGAARTRWPARRPGTRRTAPARNPASLRDLLWRRCPAT